MCGRVAVIRGGAAIGGIVRAARTIRRPRRAGGGGGAARGGAGAAGGGGGGGGGGRRPAGGGTFADKGRVAAAAPSHSVDSGVARAEDESASVSGESSFPPVSKDQSAPPPVV